ncbi:uncharacterized protein LOC130136848 [Syzygium oleosum]|uniref:uncharacterized protein LOC130136848 n=1 Tax=Syzygium oleosum TaxID=219896 RepID=UPI0024B913FB|nr:uncharacterized protein LOC130136848 [Syzygium oleosum]
MAVPRILFLAAVISPLSFSLSVVQSPPTPPAQSPSPANSSMPEASASAPVIPPRVTSLTSLLSLLLAASAPSPSMFTSPPSPPASTTTASTTISLPPLAASSPPVEGTVMPEAPSSGAVTNKFALSGVLAAGFAAALAV